MNRVVERLKKNNLLIRLTLSFFVTTAIVVVVVTIMFSLLYRSEISSDLDKMANFSLSNIALSIGSIFDFSISTAYALYTNPEIFKYLHLDSHDSQLFLRISRFISNYVLSNPDVYSIDLNSAHSGLRSYGRPAGFAEDNAPTAGFMDSSRILYPVLRSLRSADGESLALYSFIYRETVVDGFRPSVIVNVKVDSVYGRVYSDADEIESDIIITDRQGLVLMNRSMEMAGLDISETPFFRKANTIDDQASSFKITFDGTEYYVSSRLFGNGKYRAFILTDLDTFFSRITGVRRTITIISLLVLLVVVVVSLYFSVVLYSTINNMFLRVLGLTNLSENSVSMGMSHVSRSINLLIEGINSLEFDKKNKLEIAKDAFVKDIFLSDGYFSDDYLREGLKQYCGKNDIGDDARYLIVVYRINGFKRVIESNSEKAVGFFFESMIGIINQHMGERHESLVFRVGADHIVGLTGLTNESYSSPGAQQKRVITQAQRIQSMINELLNIELTVGVSEFCDLSVMDIREKYLAAHGLTNYRLSFDRISLFTEHSLKLTAVDRRKALNAANRILKSVRAGSLDEFKTHVRALFESVRYCQYGEIIRTLFFLVESIYQQASRAEDVLVPSNLDPDDLYATLKRFENYEEVEAYLIQCFMKAQESLSEMSNMKTGDMMTPALEYIEKNCGDPNITARLVAEKLSITPQYFSRIFRKTTGCSFPEYITDLRMEKAKVLLLSGEHMSISEICAELGYHNEPYFSNLFKRKYNCSPTRFRQVNREATGESE